MTALMDQAATTGQLSGPNRRAAVRSVLSRVERVIFRGDSLAVARANAWSAVQEDKVRARERAEATAVFGAPAKPGAGRTGPGTTGPGMTSLAKAGTGPGKTGLAKGGPAKS